MTRDLSSLVIVVCSVVISRHPHLYHIYTPDCVVWCCVCFLVGSFDCVVLCYFGLGREGWQPPDGMERDPTTPHKNFFKILSTGFSTKYKQNQLIKPSQNHIETISRFMIPLLRALAIVFSPGGFGVYNVIRRITCI